MTLQQMDDMTTTYLKNLEQVKQALIDTVQSLPDNQKINRLSENCFTINHSDLSADLCLTPEYYDFKAQYKLLTEIIENNTPLRIRALFNTIIEKGSVYYPTSHWHRFHPDVVEHLKTLVG